MTAESCRKGCRQHRKHDVLRRKHGVSAKHLLTAGHERRHRSDHDQRMIGDDDIGIMRTQARFFDKTLAVMPAGRMDTFTPPVGKTHCRAMPKQINEPGRKGAAGQVTFGVASAQRAINPSAGA